MERIDQYQPRGVSIFFWLRRIAINRAIDQHRAQQRRQRLASSLRVEPERTMGMRPLAPDRAPEIAETRERVQRSLAKLNKRYARALTLRLLEEKTREECAQVLGVTMNNFDVIFHRACKAFRKAFPP